MSFPPEDNIRLTKRASAPPDSFNDSLVDVQNENFVSLKDHIYLIDATASKKGSPLDVGVEVSTSLVSSPARVIKHVEPSERELADPLKQSSLYAVSSESDLHVSEGNLVPASQKSTSRGLNFEQSSFMIQKATCPDDLTNKLNAKKRGGGATQPVSSRYLQPRQGPLKATERNMDALKNSVKTSASVKDHAGTKQTGNLRKVISASSSNLSTMAGKLMAKSQNSLNVIPKAKPSSLMESKKRISTSDLSGLQPTTTNLQRPPANKGPYFTSNLVTPDKQTSAAWSESSARPSKASSVADSSLVQATESGFKTGKTSTPNSNQVAKNMSYYVGDVSSIEPSALVLAPDSRQIQNQVASEINTKKVEQSKPKMTEEQVLEVLYSRYLQGVYLDAKVEKLSKDSEQQAITQILQMYGLAAKTRKKRIEAEKSHRLKKQKIKMAELVNILESHMQPLLPKLESSVEVYEDLADAVDKTRNFVETTGIYLPDGKTEEGAKYYEDLMSELLESESIMKEMVELTKDHKNDLVEASEATTKMSKVSKECVTEIERSFELIKDMAGLTLSMSTAKPILDSDERDKRSKWKYARS